MKKRLLALLTVVLLLSITAVSSFALEPNRVPSMKEYFPDDVVLYPSNASQDYNNPNYQLWYETTCPYCKEPAVYTPLVTFNPLVYEGNYGIKYLYIPIKDIDGLYTISSYGIDSPSNSIIIQINYDEIDSNYGLNNMNFHACSNRAEGKNPITYGDVYFTSYSGTQACIYYHVDSEETVWETPVNSPVAMVIPKWESDGSESTTYKLVYDSFRNYVHNNSNTLSIPALSRLAYNTISYSVYDKSIYDDYLSQYTEGYNNGYSAGETEGYNNGYSAGEYEGHLSGEAEGYQWGFDNGYSAGEAEGRLAGEAEGYQYGFNNGYTAGETEGYQNGYNNGYTAGEAEGYNSGYTAGETESYNSGYTAGYNEGRITGQAEASFFDNGMENLFDGLFKGFGSFIDPVLNIGWGTLTIGTMLGFIGVVYLVLILLKIVRG